MATAPTSTPSPSAAPAASPAPVEGGGPSAAAPAAPSVAEALFPDTATPASTPAEVTPQPDSTPAASEASPTPQSEGADSESGAATESGTIDPAAYEFAFPADFTPSDDLVAEARGVLAAAGVPADKAQSIIDLYVKTQTSANSTATVAFETQQREWLSEINSMPEFQGATRETSLQSIGRVLDEYGPDLREGLFSNPAVGNNPAVVRFMLNVAKVLTEGAATPAGRPAPNGKDGRSLQGRTLGQVLFPDQPTS